MTETTDVVIIGSGFGGAVMSLRLAEKGHKVVVLERGQRWTVDRFPRNPGDDWIFDPDQPHRQNGWLDLRLFDDMIVAQGAGVGGGSLIYANVCVDAPDHIFARGWPAGINRSELDPYYDKVGECLGLQTIPDGQLTERHKLMIEGARALGFQDRYRKLPLAVQFDSDWRYDLDDPFNHRHSKPRKNFFGKELGTCIHLGNCDIGCDVDARNTLDHNYLFGAEKLSADVRPLHQATLIEPVDHRYDVHYQRLESQGPPGVIRAARVILSAGSLGSTELLLRNKLKDRTLPAISGRLGKGWSSNGDFLTPAFYGDRKINPTQGPTISAAIDFLDGSQENQEFFIEDGGFPDIVNNFLLEKAGHSYLSRRHRRILRQLRDKRKNHGPFEDLMPWFAQGVDAADGRLFLGRKWYAPWKRQLKLDWEVAKSKAVIEAILHMHKRLAKATGAEHVVEPPTWTVLKNLITPHPLGGCNMADDISSGVVNHAGEVFNYPGLYVVDGAIIPEAIGRNPSKTIAALAERCADHFE